MLTHRIGVVPFGFGMGDTISMRPLLRGIAESRPGSDIWAVCAQPFDCFLPEGVRAMHSIRGVPLWHRPSRSSLISHLLRAVPGRITSAVARPVVTPQAARTLSVVLNRSGFDEVFNLLETLCGLDLDARWTDGPWTAGTGHVIDAMADTLQRYGVDVPRERRRPSLPRRPIPTRSSPRVTLNPNAGSSLKEAPPQWWAVIARELIDAGFIPYMLSGRDNFVASKVQQLVPQVRLVDTPNASTLMSIVSASNLVVSVDTGVLHLAAALDVPYLGLFGSTSPTFLGPYGAATEDIVMSGTQRTDVCRRCWTAQLLPHAACGLKYDPGCLSQIESDAVLTRIFAKLAASPGVSRSHAASERMDGPQARQ